VLFNLFVIVEPVIYFRVCSGTPIKKKKKHELLVRKSNISQSDTSTNKQLLQKLKSKKFNDSVVLAFLECSCYIQNLVIRQKEPVSQIRVVPFSNFSSWIAFGPLRIKCLFYIWTAHYHPHLRCCYYFTSHTFSSPCSAFICFLFSFHYAYLISNCCFSTLVKKW